jgi:hypothetical protein
LRIPHSWVRILSETWPPHALDTKDCSLWSDANQILICVVALVV